MISAAPQSLTRATSHRLLAALIALAVAAMSMIATQAATAAPPIASPGAGWEGPSYSVGSPGEPTEDKPQSKVWFHDGSWWGGLWSSAFDEYRIHKLVRNGTDHTWTVTNTRLDDRSRSHADYLSIGNDLYVASSSGDSQAEPILVFKYTYSGGTYVPDPAFVHGPAGDQDPGVIAGMGPTETVTIARDGTGQLWITYTANTSPTTRNVMINRSTTAPSVWGTPFALAEAGSVDDDDISAIVTFAGNVGVMWSDQTPIGGTDPAETAFYFAQHADSNPNDTDWTNERVVLGGEDIAEDHINLKLVASGARVLAAVKTAGGPDSILLMDRNASTGAWTRHVVVGGGQDATRPQVVIDSTAQRAYVFYTSPVLDSDPGDQAIYHKSAPLSTLAFTPTGLGTAFIKKTGVDINDISTSKQQVTSTSGLLGIAASETNQRYYHGFLPLGGTPPPTGGTREVVRVAGNDRFGTAAELSKLRFAAPVSPTVFIATGMNFPDALAAGPAAGERDGPILLVTRDGIPQVTKNELTRLSPSKIYVVGGPSVISASVQNQLAAYADGGAANVERLSGSTRFATAVEVSKEVFAPNRPSVFIATGMNFPDALAAGPAATLQGVPILLVEQNSIPAVTRTELNRLTPATIFIVGGTSMVSANVQTQLRQYTDSESAASVVRLAGANRFATNVEIVKRFWTAELTRSAIANGMNFPDALAAGPYAFPLHLVEQNSVRAVVRSDIERLDPDRIDALGGPAMISNTVINQLKQRQ